MRCSFRCPYCMPAEIYGEGYRFMPRAELLSFEEIERLARIFVELGVEKIRITGGEPLLRHGVQDLVASLAGIPGLRDLTLTTNGWLLTKYAKDLAAAGLNRVTVSLDALDPGVFARMNGVGAKVALAILSGMDADDLAHPDRLLAQAELLVRVGLLLVRQAHEPPAHRLDERTRLGTLRPGESRLRVAGGNGNGH